MNRLKAMMQDRGAQHRRELRCLRVPPLQQLKHQARHGVCRRWQIVPDSHANGSVSTGFALIHYLTGQTAVQFQHVIVSDRLQRRRMHVPRAGVLLQRRNPRQIHRRALDALAQRRDALSPVEQRGRDGELRDVGYDERLNKRQV